ncbi:gluconokinase [Streptacidiphilus sp. ASG 303]|uniref:gluconokinase n=1 Tax=Streptomycetaceae TaxID=2062 RepID=UPI001E52D38D|nr:gluconokinase [Streptacidiphilus sp. ASG 303]MCD0483208.1 gluconokinase [Streptacidiphilus sp. ASG 303]
MGLNAENHPSCIVVMGVSGVGKTTVARLLAERLDVPFAEADDFHPAANVAKMSAGVPLDDADRQPWLESIGRWLHDRDTAGTGGVVTCSALKRRYRDTLRAASPGVFFLHLTADRALVADRIGHRSGHFMPASLLDSQLAALEPLGPDERGASLDAGPGTEHLVEMAVAAVPRPVNGDLA